MTSLREYVPAAFLEGYAAASPDERELLDHVLEDVSAVSDAAMLDGVPLSVDAFRQLLVGRLHDLVQAFP